MRVLIAMANPRDAQRLSKVLGGLGHTIAVASTPEEVAERVRTQRPDVALVGAITSSWTVPLEQPGPHIYRVALLASLDSSLVATAWNAGFDVARKAANPQELAGRVAALDRIRGWLHTMGDDFGTNHTVDLLATTSIVELGDTLAEEFGAMVGGSLAATKTEKLPEMAYSAEVPLTLAEEGMEITLGIGVSTSEADRLGTLLFGGPAGRDAMADALREFANTAGGTFKRSALDHGVTYSLGLPVDSIFPSPPPGAPIWRLGGDAVALFAWAETVDDRPRRITTGMLSEGMVLTQPVLNGSGVLLVQAGAVLTQSTVRRLLDLIGPSALVEVVRAA